MPNHFDSPPTSLADVRFALVVARYNQTITDRLLAGAVETLTSRGVSDTAIDVARVPGAGNCR